MHELIRIEVRQRLLACLLADAFAHEGGVDSGVDDEMRDVDVLWAELARHALRHRAQAGLGAGERRIADAAAHARGRAGEEDAALAAWQHQPGGLAPAEEAGIAGELPDLAKYALRRFQQRKIDVSADVEDADFERRVRIGGLQKGGDVLFLARIEPARHDLAAGGFDIADERRELVGVAPAGEDRKALGGKFFRDGCADEISGANNRGGGVAFSQIPSSHARPTRCGIVRYLSR
jgi:hypothetical protein